MSKEMPEDSRNDFIFQGSQKLNEEKLKSILYDYINSENLNVLLGSGCSVGTMNVDGIPTMQMMTNNFWEIHTDFSLGDKEGLKARLQNKTLEQILEYLVAAKLLNELEIFDLDEDNKLEKIKHFIRNQVMEGMHKEEILNLYKRFYYSLTSATRKHPINIFTTNYDLYNEEALDALGFPYNDGFSGTYKRTFNPMVYNFTLVDNMNLDKNVWQTIQNFVNLYKIHGSISWFADGESIVMRDPFTVSPKTNNPMLIYPIPLKDRTSLMTPYSDLMRNVQYELLKPNSALITIGYSFGDDHINRIIFNALAVPSFHLVIFGRSTNIEKIKKLNNPRIIVCYSEGDASTPIHYFQTIIDRLLPEGDYDEKEKIGKQIIELLTEEKG